MSEKGKNHPKDGACLDGDRWYVVGTWARTESYVVRELADAGFVAHLPMVIAEHRQIPARMMSKRQRGKAPLYVRVHVPLFPGYLFVQFNAARDPWRRIVREIAGVRTLFRHTENSPTPLPHGAVEALQAGADERLVLRSAEPLIAAGAIVRVVDGPFVDHAGVCLWSDETRLRAMMDIFGRETEVELLRRSVRVE